MIYTLLHCPLVTVTYDTTTCEVTASRRAGDDASYTRAPATTFSLASNTICNLHNRSTDRARIVRETGTIVRVLLPRRVVLNIAVRVDLELPVVYHTIAVGYEDGGSLTRYERDDIGEPQ